MFGKKGGSFYRLYRFFAFSTHISPRSINQSAMRDESELIRNAFNDAYRSNRIQQGDDPQTLPDPYKRSVKKLKSKHKATSSPGGFLTSQDQDVEMDSGGGGGFLPPSDDEEVAGGGGFLPPENQDDDDEVQIQEDYQIQLPTHLPLSSIPDALTNLNLSSNDETVLSLFQQAAEKPTSSRRRAKSGQVQEKEVSRERFEEIVKILLESKEQDQDSNQEEEEDDVEDRVETSNDRRRRNRPQRDSAIKSKSGIRKSFTRSKDDDDEMDLDQDDESSNDSQDEFRINRNREVESDEGGEEPESAFDEEDEIQTSSSKKKKGKQNAKVSSPSSRKSATGGSRRKRKSLDHDDDLEDDEDRDNDEEEVHFSNSQRDQVFEIWEMLINASEDRSKIGSKSQDRDGLKKRRIGKKELTSVIKMVGEKFGDIEVSLRLELDHHVVMS